MSNSAFAARATAIIDALKGCDHLPAIDHVYIHTTGVSFGVAGPHGTFEAVTKLAQWADNFGSLITIDATWVYGSGRIITTIPFAAGDADLDTNLSTALAYELGRLLGRELPERGGVVVQPQDLLAALAAKQVA